ncbi:MAG: pentapeptide repeat-containing protein, partial [Cyanobacteriota bacterium]
MEVSEFRSRYQAGERDFPNIHLSGANLSDTQLFGINLSGADLSGADL